MINVELDEKDRAKRYSVEDKKKIIEDIEECILEYLHGYVYCRGDYLDSQELDDLKDATKILYELKAIQKAY